MEQAVLDGLVGGAPFYGPVLAMMFFFIVILWRRLGEVSDREVKDGKENVATLTRAADVMKDLEIQLRDLPQVRILLHQAVGVINELISNPDFRRKLENRTDTGGPG